VRGREVKRLLVTLGLVLLTAPLWAQGSATLICTPPTQSTDGSPITGTLSYKFYRGTVLDTYPISQTATTCGTVFSGLTPGTHYFAATAIVGGQESALSNVASKTLLAQTPPPPVVQRVTSTRIEAAEWTCRDSAGLVLTSHTRADKAQEECTNRALASPGVAFEIRPSGYRIVTQ
jgi:hypothetical protein